MKRSILVALFTGTLSLLQAQVNTNSTSIPNTGANTTVPPSNTYSTQNNNMSVPTNSTVPGSNGSYSIDPAKPDMSSPNGGYIPPPPRQGTGTYSPQTGSGSEQKKKK